MLEPLARYYVEGLNILGKCTAEPNLSIEDIGEEI
jgi:hypothetical protein